jgi:NTE family protein
VTATAFVLGGGGVLGAAEVGMLRALLERDIVPDVVIGTSVGAINGVAVAAEPTLDVIDPLEQLWRSTSSSNVFGASMFARARTFTRTRTHLHDIEPLRTLVRQYLPVTRIEDLRVRFQCVAACIETASEHWFTAGDIEDAVLASCAVPGLLPAVEVNGLHFYDGGLVNSIPVDRAAAVGATNIYVLQVGRVEQPLTAPRGPLEVALVAFEIARRHRFARGMESLPEGCVAHVLPSGAALEFTDLSQLRYTNTARVPERIERAYEATADYLDSLDTSKS